MIDDTAGAGEPGAGNSAAPESESPETGERVAFCQQCGKGLSAETVRRAGSAVYCEPCLVTRLEGQATGTGAASTGAASTGTASAGAGSGSTGWTSVNAPPPNTGATGQPAGGPAPVSNEPSPWLAAFLGLIPGVGAMYNGQYAKGIAHLVIFAVLDSLSHNVNDIFGLLVLGWVFYQVFDAYHTAKARRDGTPLPNPFALNDIGDRMGFGKNWPGSVSRPVTSATTAGWATAAAGTGPAAPPPQSPNWSGPGWSGYVPPTNFGANAPPPPPPAAQPTAYASTPPGNAGWTQTPYANTYGGDPWHSPAGPPVPPMPPLPARRFPMGAAWLIALGLIFLMANLNGSWRLGGSWAVAIILAALGFFLLFRRVEMVLAWSKVAGDADVNDYGIASRVLCQVRWPVMLLVLALLFGLQAAGIRTLGQTWGVLLIAFGALLILERTAGRTNWHPMGVPQGATAPPATASRPAATESRASGKDGQ